MTLQAPTSPSIDHDSPDSITSKATFQLCVPGSSRNSEGKPELKRAAVKKLDRAVDAVDDICSSVGWGIRSVVLDDGVAYIRFEPPAIGDLLSTKWTEEEFIAHLRSLLEDASTEIVRRAKVVAASAESDVSQNVESDHDQQQIQKDAAGAAVGRLIKVGVGVAIVAGDEKSLLALPQKAQIWKVAGEDRPPTKASFDLEAISRDGQTGYDGYGRTIDLRGIDSARDLRPGDTLHGLFISSPRRLAAALLPVANQSLRCTSSDGESFVVEAKQLSLLDP